MRVVLTGAGGGLGRAMVRVLGGTDHDVTALTHPDLDIADERAVDDAIRTVRPHLVVNAAAYTSVDGCERADNAESAFGANALGPRNLAHATERVGAVLVHISTDYVFDGETGAPYDENASPNPIQRYGHTKLEGERLLREATERHLIVRTAYVFGGGDDYLSVMVRRLAAGEDAGAISDRVGSPTYVVDLAERLLPLARTEAFGTYHLAGPETTSRFDVLTRAKVLGGARLRGDVSEQHADDLDLPAARPRDSSLRSASLHAMGDVVPAMPPLDDAIDRFVTSILGDV